ncbi:hypothetical protein QYE76_004775 [Lolium multiflorum]|uniref:DUF4216 domain-containing protein n=1 Tax=Lolium multiflorum TaxID=4521 RepID=A0AAD8RSS8_LOLMU|nr:hypothetical protein QYE76_004775 [Lolium multiflorum]
METFGGWLRKHFMSDNEVVDQLYMLAKTPSSTITTFQGYEINGNTFYTIAQDKKSTNQNSGVRFDAATENGQKVTYYGYIEEIWELDYGPSFKVPLFRCKWFKLTGGGVKVDQQYGMTMVDFNNLGYLDEPFVLAKDVAQVFYVKDMSRKPRKRKDKKTISTSCDDPKRHIVLSGKRNIVGVEDKTDMSEDYNMFGEIPPFKVNTDPSIKLNDEDAPWIRPNLLCHVSLEHSTTTIPLRDGYARVTVEEIVPGFEDLEIDIATPGEKTWRCQAPVYSGKRSLSSFRTRRQGEQVPPVVVAAAAVVVVHLHLLHVSRRRPQFTSGGRRRPHPPRRRSSRPAKKRKQSWTINPDPYVPRTTKIPGPSLKPLTPRPYDLSVEENAAVVAAQHEKWQADCKKKREPEPKPVYSDKQKKWAKSFLTEPSQAAKNLPDYYSHELRRQAFILKEKQELAEKQEKKASHSEKKRGKQVAQLGAE